MKQLEKNEVSKSIKHLKLVDGALFSLERLVCDILEMTKFNHDQISNTLLDIPMLVEESLLKLSHMEGYSRIEFIKNYDELNSSVSSSHPHLVHIIENLISNAIKYQDREIDSPQVIVKAKSSPTLFELSVSDNGLGIPEKQRDHVFSMFKRFHPKISFGSGLGLYMLNKNVERLQGKITYNALQKGTQFNVRIPLNTNEPEAKRANQ